MGDFPTQSRIRRAFLFLIPAAFSSARLVAQRDVPPVIDEPQEDVRLPNGKKQKDEILKRDYEKNVKDAQDLVNISKSFEEDLEKDDRFVLSLSSLKKLEDIEKLTRRIRGRMMRV
jgi:hypothetical protein